MLAFDAPPVVLNVVLVTRETRSLRLILRKLSNVSYVLGIFVVVCSGFVG